MNKIQAIRGMRDVLPDETPMWQWLERKLHHMAFRYGYQEMRLPLLEPVTLFERAVGEATDIVSKEMYDFTDKSGEHISACGIKDRCFAMSARKKAACASLHNLASKHSACPAPTWMPSSFLWFGISLKI